MLVVFFLNVISSFFVIQQEMTDIFNEVTAALSNRNTTANAIIWTTAKASWFKKRSSRGGRSSRRRFSSRKKQRTPISKDTATLFKKKSSGGSRRRRSRREKQKREFTSELKPNVLLDNKAPTTSKHARGTFTIWPFSRRPQGQACIMKSPEQISRGLTLMMN